MNLPLPLCIIFASILRLSIDKTAQQEDLSIATMKSLLRFFTSKAVLYLLKLKEMVFITCLINNYKYKLVYRLKLYDTKTKHLETKILICLTD